MPRAPRRPQRSQDNRNGEHVGEPGRLDGTNGEGPELLRHRRERAALVKIAVGLANESRAVSPGFRHDASFAWQEAVRLAGSDGRSPGTPAFETSAAEQRDATRSGSKGRPSP